MVYIGIDLGTTGCKSMVFDEQGSILSQSYDEYDIIKAGDNVIEQDADIWWSLVQKSVAESVARSGRPAVDFKALSISSQGISFVPVDAAGKTLSHAISWLDSRPVSQTDEIRRLYTAEEIYRITGKRISPVYTLPKLMWVRDNWPEVYRQTDKFLMPLDYITYKLTGRALTDYSMASGTMAFNIETGCWDQGIIAACGLDGRKLPEVAVAGSLVGPLDAAVAAELGLTPDVLVILGAQDQKCAALGAGIGRGVATVSLGTASAISTLSSRPVFDREMRIPCFALGENRWILESVIGTACISLKWLKDTLMADLDYAGLDSLAAQSSPGAQGVFFYPHLEGAGTPYWRSDIRGFLYGLSLSTARRDIVRALLEGVAYQIKANIMLQEAITAEPIQEIRIFGGGSNSSLWCSLIADITGKTVSQLYTSEIANLGAALLARQGLVAGVQDQDSANEPDSRISPATDADRRIKTRFQPDPANSWTYQTAYERYMDIQAKMMA